MATQAHSSSPPTPLPARERMERIGFLRTRNPFATASVGNPWEPAPGDVPAVNAIAFDGVMRLITQKRHQAGLSLAGLVLGEVGNGKTHLIGRILKTARKQGFPFLVAYVQPIEDTDVPFTHLLRELMANLNHPLSEAKGISFLEWIISRLWQDFFERAFHPANPNAFARFQSLLRKDPSALLRCRIRPNLFQRLVLRFLEFLTNQHPQIEADLFRVLAQLHLPGRRSAAITWLKGGLTTPREAALLGVPDRRYFSPGAREEAARQVLMGLGILLANSQCPVLVCFDRLENLETAKQIRCLGKMTEFLVDMAPGWLPVVFCRGQQWQEVLRRQLNQQVVTRLETNVFELDGCGPQLAMEIIQGRMAQVLRPVREGAHTREDQLFPLRPEALQEAFEGELLSPREVIIEANRQLQEILGREVLPHANGPLAQLRVGFERLKQAIMADFDRHEPSRNRLARALALYLHHLPPEEGLTVCWIKPAQEPLIDLEGEIRTTRSSRIPIALLVDVEPHHMSVKASLERAMAFLCRHPFAHVFYIRDGRCAFPEPPRWQKTHRRRREFIEQGGQFILLHQEQVASWYALEELSLALKAGDLTWQDDLGRLQPIPPQTLDALAAERCPMDIGELLHLMIR